MKLSTPRPMPSRTVIGGKNGTTRYGPGLTPHTPSVWPKSSRLFSIPQYFAASNSPPMPAVLLIMKPEGSRVARPRVGPRHRGARHGGGGEGQQRRLGLDRAREATAPAERHHHDRHGQQGRDAAETAGQDSRQDDEPLLSNAAAFWAMPGRSRVWSFIAES